MREFELVGDPISEHDQTESSTEQMGQTYEYQVIPEFPSLIILPLLLVATVLIILYKRRLPKNASKKAEIIHIRRLIKVHC